jgi:hypothetical protein
MFKETVERDIKKDEILGMLDNKKENQAFDRAVELGFDDLAIRAAEKIIKEKESWLPETVDKAEKYLKVHSLAA